LRPGGRIRHLRPGGKTFDTRTCMANERGNPFFSLPFGIPTDHFWAGGGDYSFTMGPEWFHQRGFRKVGRKLNWLQCQCERGPGMARGPRGEVAWGTQTLSSKSKGPEEFKADFPGFTALWLWVLRRFALIGFFCCCCLLCCLVLPGGRGGPDWSQFRLVRGVSGGGPPGDVR